MSIEYEGRVWERIVDDTQEYEEGSLFVLSEQNSKYASSLPEDAVSISPKELKSLWGLDGLKVVGVSGTNGKTTTSAIIYSLLEDLGHSCAFQGTRGLYIGDERVEEKSLTTPSIFDTLKNMKRAADAGAEYFVMEVSSHAIAQNRIEGIDFALKVHTNVTRDHLDYHGTIEEYRRVKSLFFSDESMKLINRDEMKSISFNPANAWTHAVEEPAAFKILAYSLNGGVSGVIRFEKEQESFRSNLMGLFNLYNATAAISAVKLLTDAPLADICEELEYFGGVAGRMERVSENPAVIVDFAHTDDGIYRVLDSLKDKELCVVFGAGGERDRSKRPAMGAVVGRFAKKIYITSDNPRSEEPEKIIEEIAASLDGKENVHKITDRREAIRMALLEQEEDEIVLILGKGDENYQEIAGERHPFDDREVAREILAELGAGGE